MSDSSSGVGASVFPSLLAALFIGLKLTGHIDWSWWWVLAPIWIPAALALVIFIGLGGALLAARRRR